MKLVFSVFVAMILLNYTVYSQCQPGQDPNTAEHICGTKTKPSGTVPSCAGSSIPVPVCPEAFGNYVDVNPYYYTFTCYISGQLEFTIKPKTNTDDYDWQLFDFTGRNPNDIYDQTIGSSMFIACNWSGNSGTTGTSISATTANACLGNTPNITKAPMLTVGHNYLLMVSHFTSTNQSGYDLQFNNNSSNLITSPVNVPKFDTARVACSGDIINLKIDKPISCSTYVASDFDIATNPAISNVVGYGCKSANDYTDSIIIKLANPLPTGNYTINIKTGSDNNTLVDECGNAMIAGANQKPLIVYAPPKPTITAQTIKETCKVDTINYSHDGNNGTTKWQWTFDGNPTTSNLQNQQVIYTSFLSRKVKLVVANKYCSDSTTQNFPIADHSLIPKFGVSRDTTCPNNPETFTDSTKGNTNSWNWNFANGNTSNAQNPPVQVYPVLPINKLYNVKLVVGNTLGCVDSTTRDIFVRGTIPTEFDSIIQPGCAAKQVSIYFKQAMHCASVAPDGSDFAINGPAPNAILSAIINCKDTTGTTVTLQLANALIVGTYQLSLKVGNDLNTIINDCGIATLPKTLNFTAYGHVSTNFNYDSVLTCKADTITFHHIFNNSVNSWQWTFDGTPTTSNLQSPKVVYTSFAKRDVQLIVSNGVCTDTSSVISLPIVNHNLLAKFGSLDTTYGNGATIFTDSSTGVIKNWYWSFGKGLTSTAQNPAPVNYPLSYTYTTSPVQLIVKNSVGCYDTSQVKNIVIKPSAPAKMVNTDNLPCSPDSIILHFNAPMLCNTVAPDGSDFAIKGNSVVTVSSASIINCTNGLGRDVVVKLTKPINTSGIYQLLLKRGNDGNTILNDCGIETMPDSLGFIAFPKVDASFSVVNKIDCKEDTLFLNHTIANDENKWKWLVNGSLAGNVNNFILPYSQSGTKTVKLIVASDYCIDTATQVFTLVFDEIKAGFTMSQDIICPTASVLFKDSSAGNITSWNWDFGDGRPTIINQNPVAQTYNVAIYPANTGHNYTDYLVKLIVGNATPCYDTAYKTIRVTSNCLVQVATAFTPNNDGKNDNLYPLNAYKATNLKFRVYNRLGQLMFDSKSNYSWWDGTVNGVKQPAGTYVWYLEYTDKDTGNKVNLNGTSVLIR